MKKVATALKALTLASVVAMLVLFFFDFVSIDATSLYNAKYGLTGFESAFGSSQTFGDVTVNTYKGAYYFLAFVLTIVTGLFAAAGLFSKKHNAGMRWATFGFSAATAINVCALFFAGIKKYLDIRPVEVAASAITKQAPFVIFMVLSLVTVVLAAASVLVADYADVLESNGAKITIFRRIKRFFKDYKREIKNIVWPTPKTLFKNVVVVGVMCLIIGAFIWLLDFGVSALIKLIY